MGIDGLHNGSCPQHRKWSSSPSPLCGWIQHKTNFLTYSMLLMSTSLLSTEKKIMHRLIGG